jgi:hypothetical protein
MIDPTRKSLVVTALSLGLTFVTGSAYANLCHNIGGPRELGANCESPATTNCCVPTEEGSSICLKENQYLGILIFSGPDHLPPNDKSLAAHIRHGDGLAEVTFDPPLHLASEVGPHLQSNVECIGTRQDTTQPPEPGN